MLSFCQVVSFVNFGRVTAGDKIKQSRDGDDFNEYGPRLGNTIGGFGIGV